MEVTQAARTRLHRGANKMVRLVAASALFVGLAVQPVAGTPVRADCEELYGTASVSGVVTDADTGEPVAGASVVVRTAESDEPEGVSARAISTLNEGSEQPEIWRAATTGEDGSYTVAELPAGAYAIEFGPGLEAPARYYAPTAWTNPETSATALWVEDGAAIEGIDVQMEARLGAVTGTITVPDGVEDGAKAVAYVPREGHSAQCEEESPWEEIASADADEEGNYVLSLEPGTYRIGFLPKCPKSITNGTDEEPLVVPSYYPDATTLEAASDVTVEAKTDTTADGAVALNPNAAFLVGRATDASGTPVECAYVIPYYFAEGHGFKPLWGAKVKTDENGNYSTAVLAGTFRLKCQPNSGELAYAFYPSAGSATEGEDIVVAAGEEATANFQLGVGGWLVGKLTDQLGQGPTIKDYWKYTVYRLVADDQWEAVGYYATEGARYELGGLPAGTYKLGFGWGGADWLKAFYYFDATDFADAADIEVAEGATVELEDAQYLGDMPTDMDAWSSSSTVKRGAAVRLTARLSAGTKPVRNARVRVYRDNGSGWKWTDTVLTGSTGRANVRTKLSRTTKFRFVYKGQSDVNGDRDAVSVRVK
ncbi:MAG: carboxypeptidase regulatory-like domain-containing protein [Coriobacteriales bacterium]|nr:carboxypeptidase regulatory-like domain-containing protein [Coriobacteriales bacterium]